MLFVRFCRTCGFSCAFRRVLFGRSLEVISATPAMGSNTRACMAEGGGNLIHQRDTLCFPPPPPPENIPLWWPIHCHVGCAGMRVYANLVVCLFVCLFFCAVFSSPQFSSNKPYLFSLSLSLSLSFSPSFCSSTPGISPLRCFVVFRSSDAGSGCGRRPMRSLVGCGYFLFLFL